ncbi:DUF3526 domain-containing protein [Sinomicrobium sp. M5D2P9]
MSRIFLFPMNSHRVLRTLILKDSRLVYRGGTLSLLFGLTWFLLIASGILTMIEYHKAQQDRELANLLFRQQWEEQHKGAHDAAHYGTWIFKPLNVLGAFHPGLNDFSGTTYRVEAHKQQEVDHSNAEGKDSIMRFGQFSFALILQFLVPLLILFLASSAVTSERESGTLRMLLAQGVSFRRLVWSKIWVNYLYGILLVLPVFLVILVSVWVAGEGGQAVLRLSFIFLGYLLYYLLCVLIGVIISVRSTTSKISAFTALTFWLLTVVLLPKVVTNMADHRFPPMSRATFDDRVTQGYREGLNRDGPYYERARLYEKELLSRYGADSTAELPVDVDALVMQYHEDYKSTVFTYYYKQVSETFDRQQKFISNAIWTDPFIGIKRLSSAMSGTDFFHHRAFFTQARAYRDYFIRSLNLEQAKHPERGEEQYHPDADFFRRIEVFQYRELSVGQVLKLQQTAFYGILGWILLAVLILHFITKNHPGK